MFWTIPWVAANQQGRPVVLVLPETIYSFTNGFAWLFMPILCISFFVYKRREIGYILFLFVVGLVLLILADTRHYNLIFYNLIRYQPGTDQSNQC